MLLDEPERNPFIIREMHNKRDFTRAVAVFEGIAGFAVGMACLIASTLFGVMGVCGCCCDCT